MAAVVTVAVMAASMAVDSTVVGMAAEAAGTAAASGTMAASIILAAPASPISITAASMAATIPITRPITRTAGSSTPITVRAGSAAIIIGTAGIAAIIGEAQVARAENETGASRRPFHSGLNPVLVLPGLQLHLPRGQIDQPPLLHAIRRPVAEALLFHFRLGGDSALDHAPIILARPVGNEINEFRLVGHGTLLATR